MADEPSSKPKDQNKEPPDPEVLKPKVEIDSSPGGSSDSEKTQAPKQGALKHRARTYRPSHKATFIGLAVVIAILAINSAIIIFIVKHQSKETKLDQGQVTINEGALDKLGVKTASLGDKGIELTVNPDSRFNGKVTIAGDTRIGGQLILSKKLSASEASLTKLQAGDTSLNQLNVNGDGTVSNLSLRKDLNVAGNSRLQGAVIITNSANISGSLSIGGQLSVNTLHINSLVADSVIQIGGHFITSGLTPGAGSGSCGHATISGNDSAGTIFVSGNCSGPKTVASVTFRSAFSGYPHVVVTPVCSGVTPYLASVNNSGFSMGINGSIGGGCQFNYLVMQ